jgi:hypothetical protein
MLSKSFKEQMRQEVKAAICIADIQQIHKKITLELLKYKLNYINKQHRGDLK